ncbi:hypothetical protein MHBO_001045, partial [Bonamia ostreae]
MITRSTSQKTKSEKSPKKLTENESAPTKDSKDKLQRLEIEKIDLLEKSQNLKTRLDELASENQRLKRAESDFENYKTLNEKQKSEHPTLLQKIVKLEKSNADLKESLRKSTESTQRLEKLTEKTKTANEKFEAEMDQKNKEIFALKQRIIDGKEEITNLKNESDSSFDKIKFLETTIADAEKRLEKTLNDLEAKETELTTQNSLLLSKTNTTSVELNRTKIELEEALQRNSSLALRNEELKKEAAAASADHKSKLTQKTRSLEQTTISLGMKNQQIELYKESARAYEEHIEALRGETVSKEHEIAKIAERLAEKENAFNELQKKIASSEFSQNGAKREFSFSQTIGEIASVLNPGYSPRKILRVEASPNLSPNELYIKFVRVYDSYKAAFKEKLALEDGLKRFSRYVESKSPNLRRQQVKYEMLRKSYGNMSNRLAAEKRKGFSREVELKAVRSELEKALAKKTAYKKSTRILKQQVQLLVAEQVPEEQNTNGQENAKDLESPKNKKISEHVFVDFRELHGKYLKLLKKHNERAQREKFERADLEKENGRLVEEFARARGSWEESERRHRRDMKELVEKISTSKKLFRRDSERFVVKN